METKIYKDLTYDEIQKLGKLLKDGELVAIPTETVYGLGGNGLDPKVINKIYEVKGRPSDNPVILHVADSDEVKPLVKDIPKLAKSLMETFWPGPLTIIMRKSDKVPLRATGGLETVAIRCPDNDVTRSVIKEAGVPLAAPSANISGKPSPTSANGVYEDMHGKIAAIIDGGNCKVGIESTVVEVVDDAITILRPGMVTDTDLRKITNNVYWDKALKNVEEKPKSPGMKYKHYAPNAIMKTYIGKSKNIVEHMLEDMESSKDSKYALLISAETLEILKQKDAVSKYDFNILNYGSKNDPMELAHNLYDLLIQSNKLKVDFILAEGVREEGLGIAVMNRLTKASNNNVVKV